MTAAWNFKGILLPNFKHKPRSFFVMAALFVVTLTQESNAQLLCSQVFMPNLHSNISLNRLTLAEALMDPAKIENALEGADFRSIQSFFGQLRAIDSAANKQNALTIMTPLFWARVMRAERLSPGRIFIGKNPGDLRFSKEAVESLLSLFSLLPNAYKQAMGSPELLAERLSRGDWHKDIDTTTTVLWLTNEPQISRYKTAQTVQEYFKSLSLLGIKSATERDLNSVAREVFNHGVESLFPSKVSFQNFAANVKALLLLNSFAQGNRRPEISDVLRRNMESLASEGTVDIAATRLILLNLHEVHSKLSPTEAQSLLLNTTVLAQIRTLLKETDTSDSAKIAADRSHILGSWRVDFTFDWGYRGANSHRQCLNGNAKVPYSNAAQTSMGLILALHNITETTQNLRPFSQLIDILAEWNPNFTLSSTLDSNFTSKDTSFADLKAQVSR